MYAESEVDKLGVKVVVQSSLQAPLSNKVRVRERVKGRREREGEGRTLMVLFL